MRQRQAESSVSSCYMGIISPFGILHAIFAHFCCYFEVSNDQIISVYYT